MQSLIDSAGEAKINSKTREVKQAVVARKMVEATRLWGEAEELIENVTNGVNFYNILTKSPHNSTATASTTTTTTTTTTSTTTTTNSVRQEASDQVLSDYNGTKLFDCVLPCVCSETKFVSIATRGQ